MLQTGVSLIVFLTVLGRVVASPEQVVMAGTAQARAAPTVILDTATVTGISSVLTGTNEFRGIPYAQPPTGNLRFQRPQRLPPYRASFSATEFGRSCPEQRASLALPCSPLKAIDDFNSSIYSIPPEDCLTLNVVTPATATATSKLPVVVWFYGGGFQVGGTKDYSGSDVVRRAINLNVPAVYVSMNFRSTAFGFLASQEVKDAGVGNLGLRDQRLALQWVQEYIGAFGGDPKKVTIWGESSGAISISLQMLTNGGDTEGLFRAAFMQSGAPIPVGDISHGQPYYDFLVKETNCTGEEDTLQCLREVDFDVLMAAVNKTPDIFSYQSLVLAWLPRVDGERGKLDSGFLTEKPLELVQQGSVANIPVIMGNCDDEGTIFSFSNKNITEDEQLAEYLHTYWILPKDHHSTPAMKINLRSSSSESLHFREMPSFKHHDDSSYSTDPSSRISGRLFHGSDLAYSAFLPSIIPSDMMSYLLRFVANLDPNVGSNPYNNLYWPQYHYGESESANETMLAFEPGGALIYTLQNLTTDTYRADPMAYLTQLLLDHPIL